MVSSTYSPAVKRRAIVIFVLVTALVLALASLPAVAGLVTDWYWFMALQYESIFLKTLGTKLGLGLGVGLAAFAFFYFNLRLAQRGVVPDLVIASVGSDTQRLDLARLLRNLSLPASAVLGLMMGLAAAGNWLILLQFLNSTPFGDLDPVFGKDVAYYVFTLPALSAVTGFAVAFAVVALFTVVPIYVLRRDIVVHPRRVAIDPSAETHLGWLLAVLFVVTAINLFLVRIPSLVYSTAGPLFGASYSDLAIRVPLLFVLGVVAVLGTGVVIFGAYKRRLIRNTIVAVGVYVAVSALGSATAATIQKVVVAPNELEKESQQIEFHIAATQRAWGLDAVEVRDLSGEATLTLADIQANSGTVRNIRLWDRDLLLQTFRQIQEIRTYYDFQAVDDDRYWIGGEYRQVLLSPRELNTASLPTRNFINERLTYTHGMGLTLSPVNEVSPEGLPILFIKDLPPSSSVSLEIERPEVYYGEISSEYVFVNTRHREFDYPLGDTSAFTVYEGTGGVRVNSFLRKLFMSLHFGSTDILLTDLITRESRVLYHRRISERASKALPFLEWDRDPYIVVTDDGRLKWILDAYTASSRYPYSLPVSGGTNYMRNSVKVVIDAYDGDVRAYIADAADPIVQTYAKIFPDIFVPLDSMPADLRAHVRYPSDLFRIQTDLYTTYHMDEPDVFYAREDQWQIPSTSEGAGADAPFLRRIVMKLPGEPQEEYISMTPFTPRQKDNLAAWMVARSDGAHYGQLVVYRFPRQSLVFGPTQIANRINQDTEISRQISLWDQRGSEVIRGNLLVIPIEGSLLFVQALYLRAEGGRIPELKRVIVAHQNQVVMEETLGEGLARLFGRGAIAAPASEVLRVAAATAAPATSEAQVAELISEVSSHYERAIAAQRVGDWARYGEEMRLVGELLRELQNVAGGGSGN